jgi:mannose-6-phosphate isomerase-like protein (cupin superfamily)
MAENNPVAARIRHLREARKLSLAELSERSALSAAEISRIEEGMSMPSLAPLLKIARGLGVRLGTLLDDVAQPGPVVVRAGEIHDTVHFTGGARRSAGGLDLHSLAANKQDRHMEPFIVEARPAAAREVSLSSHEGEEFMYVLSGELEISYGKETHRLAAGDSIYYDSIVPHDVHAAPGHEARLLAVVFTPC